MMSQPTNPSGRLLGYPEVSDQHPWFTFPESNREIVDWVHVTGAHGEYIDNKPQSVTVLRNQLDAQSPGSCVDLMQGVWHLRNQQLVVNNGISRIRGGVFIIEPTAGGRAGILIRGRTEPLLIEDMTLIVIGQDSANQEACIYCYESTGAVTIRGCTFAGAPKSKDRYIRRPLIDYIEMSSGRAISAKSSATAEGGGIVVDGCSILSRDERETAAANGHPAIDISGNISGNERSHYQANKTPVPVRQWYRNAKVIACDIRGGRYGISINACDGAVVEGNLLDGHMRSISCQNSTKNLTVVRNYALDFKSTSVHMAYGTSDARVADNTVASNKIEGQAMIQAYCSVSDIEIARNTCVSLGTAPGPWCYIYAGNDCQSISIHDNRLSGPVRAAVLGIDQSWTVAGGVTPSYVIRYDGDAVLGTTKPSYGHSVAGNVALLSDKVPMLVVTTTTDAMGIGQTDAVSIMHNGRQVAVKSTPVLLAPPTSDGPHNDAPV